MAIIKKFRIKSFKKNIPIIKLDKISLSFGKRKILDDISFSINKNQILGLLGPNGVGKSTIFNLRRFMKQLLQTTKLHFPKQ